MTQVKKELDELKERYGDERRTQVIKSKVGQISDEDLVIKEDCIITISESGYIKRMKESTYRTQGRGGSGVSGGELKEEDRVETIRTCTTHDWALFFTNTGRVYKLRIWEIPEYSRKAKGTPLVNFLSITSQERIGSFLTVSSEAIEAQKGYV